MVDGGHGGQSRADPASLQLSCPVVLFSSPLSRRVFSSALFLLGRFFCNDDDLIIVIILMDYDRARFR